MLARSRFGVSAIRLAIILMLVALMLFIGLFSYFIIAGIRQTHQQLEESALSSSQIVATNAFWIAELANQTLHRVDAALGPQMLGSEEDILNVLQGLPLAADVFVIDQHADTVFSTLPGARDVHIDDREYFTAVRDGAPFFTSSLLTSRVTGDAIFVFSKRIERNDEFVGAVMVQFAESLLASIRAGLDIDEASTVSLIREDGQLMARYPPAAGPVDLGQHPLITEHMPRSDVGTYVSDRSPVDGIARLVSYRKVDGAPIIALASVATDATWANFRVAIATVILIASPILIGLTFGSWWVARLLRRDAERARELEASVELNTMLFREIHHRVKNNLQSVQALIRMQDMPHAAKTDLQSRLAAMAAMHEHIYKYDRYQDIDTHEFIPVVVEQVRKAYGADAEIVYRLDHVAIDRDHATPLALLLSEVITNAFKYAFSDGRAGRVDIQLTERSDGRVNLVIKDNGVGMPETEPRERSMGMRLIKGVVAQMGGEYRFSNDDGLVFDATIALSQAARATVETEARQPVAAS